MDSADRPMVLAINSDLSSIAVPISTRRASVHKGTARRMATSDDQSRELSCVRSVRFSLHFHWSLGARTCTRSHAYSNASVPLMRTHFDCSTRPALTPTIMAFVVVRNEGRMSGEERSARKNGGTRTRMIVRESFFSYVAPR
jgi:hypothetical protein